MAVCLAFFQAILSPIKIALVVVGLVVLGIILIFCAPFLLIYFMYDRKLKSVEKQKMKVKNESNNFRSFLDSVRDRVQGN